VSVASCPLWRVRLALELPRYVLMAASVAGLIASLRYALLPPRPRAPAAPRARGPRIDRAAEGFAALFARRYLSWSPAESEAGESGATALAGTGFEDVAPVPPPGSGERVEWAEVVQVRESAVGELAYTVAAQTDRDGLVYLSVEVARRSGGLALAGYPAIVGAPAFTSARPARAREISDGALAGVVERALTNYLAGAGEELEADLAAGARVSLPAHPLRVESFAGLSWLSASRTVTAVVKARDAAGVRFTLAYELEVVRAQGRWEVAAIQTDPYT
jgi:hypothetical protein